MKRYLLSLGLIVSLCYWKAEAREKLDGIAAVVGDEVILISEVDAYTIMKKTSGELQATIDSSNIDSLRRQMLEALIDEKVLYAHAQKDTEIVVKDEEVERALENHLERILLQNNLTISQLEEELKMRQGLTMAKFKAQLRKGIRERLYKEKVQQKHLAFITLSRKEVEEFYNQYKDSLPSYGESVRLSKLFLGVAADDSVRQAVYLKMLDIKKKLDAGASFDSLARIYSEDPSSINGGDIGFVEKGTLGELVFEQQIFSLRPGQRSDVFSTRLGYHIAEVIDKKDQKVRVRHIFMMVGPSEHHKKRALLLLDSLRAEIKTLESFSAAVRRYSTEEISRTRGGDIGWFAIADIPAKIKASFDSLKVGMVSSVVESENGFAIYQITAAVDSRPLSLEHDWTILAEKAKELHVQKKLMSLVKKWRNDIFIDIRI